MADLITDKALQAAPQKKDIWLSDNAPRGHGRFCARITKKGQRLFYFRYTNGAGKREYIPLGGYDASGSDGLTLKQARSKAGELSRLYQAGTVNLTEHLEAEKDLERLHKQAEVARLQTERQTEEIALAKANARMTVQQFFTVWLEDELSRRKDKGAEAHRIFKKDVLPAIGGFHLEDVNKGDTVAVIKNIRKRGADRLASVTFTLLRQMFNHAVDCERIPFSPMASLNKKKMVGTDNERDRVLSDDEVKDLAKKLPEAGLLPTTTAAVWVCLGTMCRIGELLNAKWEHVDFEKRAWSIPAENSKNGYALEIHLSDFTLVQFRTIQQHHHYTDWIFPNRDNSGPVSSKTVTKQLGDRQRHEPMQNRSKRSDSLVLSGGKWTPHDLRRTGATIMGALGIKPEVIDRCQNHREAGKIRRTYQRYAYQPEMSEAWRLLGERLEALTGEASTAKVIPLHRKAGCE